MAQVNRKNKHISHLVRIAIAVIALYLAFKGESIKQIVKVFGNLNILIFILAVALYALGNLIFVLRWLILLRAQSIHVNYWAALKLHLLGLFYNNCLPGSVGGDLLRAWYVTMHTHKRIEAAMSVFVDRVIGLICTIAIVFLSYWFIPAPNSSDAHLQFSTQFSLGSLTLKLLIALIILIIIAAGIIAVMFYSKKLKPVLFKYAFIFALRWKSWVSRVITAIKLYCSRPLILFSAVLLSFICQALPIYGLYLVGKDLGIQSPIKYYYVFFPLSWIIGVIPISVGGTGVMELGLKGLFGKVTAVSETQGLILALAQRFTWLIVSIPGVVIHLTGKHLPSEQEIKGQLSTG